MLPWFASSRSMVASRISYRSAISSADATRRAEGSRCGASVDCGRATNTALPLELESPPILPPARPGGEGAPDLLAQRSVQRLGPPAVASLEVDHADPHRPALWLLPALLG